VLEGDFFQKNFAIESFPDQAIEASEEDE